jgi:hypothetical protein
LEERDYGPREKMITGERGQRATAMMVGEVDRCETVDRHETTDAVKRILLRVERMLRRVIFDRERGRTRPLNRILEAAKIRREPVWALGEQNERGLFLGTGGEALQNIEG